ncbi:hypothetical protein O3M35_013195 [Rhynocoris fuscipes]|uniref:F-box domain-containing protein n=1 Tax=Rhynocoris fuscipes TaxID=488301 RepID=A0AAW1CFH3_9HEMI
MSLISDQSKACINDLPNEILEHIIGLLPPYKDFKNCMLVCKRWHRNVQNVIKHKKLDFSRALRNFNTEWEYINQTFQNNITKRYSHSACVHENSMYVFGGCTSTSTTFNDLWKLDLSTRRWQRLLTMGRYPSPKAYASLVYYKSNLILFGGWTHPSPYPLYQAWRTFNELHVYSIDENYWDRVNNSTHSPLPMAGHTATVHKDNMIIFGGLQEFKGGSNDVWCLNLTSYMWTMKETSEAKPLPRYGHSQIAINDDHLIILGGWGGHPNLILNDDVWMLNMNGNVWVWNKIAIRNNQWAATHLWCHPACKVEDFVVVLSRNPDSSPTSLAYSRWTANSQIGVNQRRRDQQRPGSLRPAEAANSAAAGPSVDRDVNVNGRRGSFTSRQSPVVQEPMNVVSPPLEQLRQEIVAGINPAPSNRRITMFAFRTDHPTWKIREKRLELLRIMEERIRMLNGEDSQQQQQEKPKNQQPKMAMFVLDISEVLENGTAQWLTVKSIAPGGPEATILYSLVFGNGELIMFGGIRKEPGFTINEREDAENPSDTVSNSLHLITAPPTSI